MTGNDFLRADWDRWALFLDIDGTLLDIAPTPDTVTVPDDLPALLDILTVGFSGALALISGRSLAEIDRLFPKGRDAAGGHGTEWRLSGTTLVVGRNGWIHAVAPDIQSEIQRLPGVLMEMKPCSIALHFQSVPDHGATVLALLEGIARDTAMPLRVLQGRAVAELLPVGWDKGRAIERFMRLSPYAERLPVFVGDDVTDEDGFRVVDKMGGLSIRVRETPFGSGLTLPSSSAVRRWLANLSHSIGGKVVQ
jgi:trehalose 6-phosphate phosphatase